MRSSILTLQSQLEQARERLKDVEDNIKKSTGRDFSQASANRPVFKRTGRHFDEADAPPVKKRVSDVKGRLGDWVTEDRPQQISRPGFVGSQRSVIPIQGRIVTRPFQQGPTWERDPNRTEESPRIPARKRLDTAPNSIQPAVTVFSRLSGPPKEDEIDKIKVTSQVLVQEMPSRKEILAAQSKDKSCKERNRRMFGALLGTLQKFRQEETKLKEKEEKKAQVERKVEEAAEREKEEAKKQRRELFTSRRQEQLNIRHLEFKLTKLKQLSEWEVNQNKLLPFIQTKTDPKIFYLPKRHNDKTKTLLQNHQVAITKAVERKRAEIEKLIEDHIPQPEEGKDEDLETPMDVSEQQDFSLDDQEMPLMPTAGVKHESDSSSSSESEHDRKKKRSRSRSTESRSTKSRSSSRSRDSSDSKSDSDKEIRIKKEKVDKDVRTSDKENHNLERSPDVKIKIEAT